MADGLSVHSNQLVLDLYDLLRSIDKSRWREGVEKAARQRLNQISERLDEILETHTVPQSDTRMLRLYEGLRTLAREIEELKPKADQSASRMREEWNQFRKRLQPTYGAIAASLERLKVPVPALRPTNYGRSFWHMSAGLSCLALVHHVLNATELIIVAVSFASFCWLMELLRIRYKGVTRAFMVVFGPIAHPHEYHRVNSSTWYGTALAVLALLASPVAASIGLVVLAVADPTAAIVGRRWGRTPLWAGRSLEGSLAFVAAGSLASLAMLRFYYPGLDLGASVITVLAASTVGAVTELASGRLDDNFTIPVGAAAGATVLLQAFGA